MVKKVCNKAKIISLIESSEAHLLCKSQLKEVKTAFLDLFNNETQFNKFAKKLDTIKCHLDDDLDFFLESDPAALSKEEIILCYPGFKAIIYYRVAHALYSLNYKLEARVISEQAHFLTGIDIHPGAKIGHPFFIDHGTGIVVGETTIIGNYVRLYQGVTLGALSLSKGAKIKGIKRHPTIGNNVIIYANASILGGSVIIGDNVIVGGNVFISESIPSNCKVIISRPKLMVIKK